VVTKYGYLIGDTILLTIWAILFWRRKDTRKEMLILSFIIGVIGPFSEYWYFKDYWNPPMIFKPSWPFGGLEDFLFGFGIGGISAVIYEIIFRRKLICPRKTKRGYHNWILLVFPLIVIAIMIILTDVHGLNSIYASSIAFLIPFALMMGYRPDLLKDAILSGLLVMSLMFAIYFFYLPYFLREIGREAWFLYGTAHGLLIFGRVPLTEMIWGMSWGMVGGPLYEFWRGCKLKPIN
jgi:hypothetical protein